MRNKDFDNFMKTGNIIDYLNYKKKKSSGERDESKGRNSCKDDKLSR